MYRTFKVANRNFPASRVFGMHLMPIRLDATASIGSSGAITVTNSLGIASITRLAVGTYQIRLQDNYAQFIGLSAILKSPVTGSSVPIASLVPGTMYEITVLGAATTAQWITAGVPVGITPAVGVTFVALATSAGASSACKAIGASGDYGIEIVGDPNVMLSSQPAAPLLGGYITFQCLGPTDSTHPAQIPVDPASGSLLFIELWLNNSQVQ